MRVLWTRAPFALRHHPAVLAAVLVTSVLVGLAAASAPLVRAGVESESLQAQLRSMTPLAAGVEITVHGAPSSDPARRVAVLKLAHGLPATGAPVLGSEAAALVPDRFGGVKVILLARTGAIAHVRHLTKTAGPGVWISDGTAKAIGLAAGQTLTSTPPSAAPGPGLPLAPAPASTRRHLRVAGIYAALDGDLANPYWQNYLQEIRLPAIYDALPPPFVLMSYPTFRQTVVGDRLYFVTDHIELPIDPSHLTLASARSLERRYAALQHELAASPREFHCACPVTSSLSSALAVAKHDVAAVSPTISLLSDFGVLIGLVAVAAAGAFLVRRRAGEAELLHARGEATAAFATRTALEGLLPALAGCAAGVGVALLALRSFAPAGTIDAQTVLAGVGHTAVAGAAGLVAFAAGAAATYPRRSDGTHPWLRLVRRAPWELLPLAAAGILLGLLLAGGGLAHDSSGSTHPRLTVFVLPVLAVAGIAGLVVRAARRLLPRRGGRTPAAVFLALRRLGAARGLLVAVVVTAAASFGAFAYATTLSSSLGRSAAEKAYVANGSDVQGVVDTRSQIVSPFRFPAALLEDDWTDVTFTSGDTVEVLAADPAALARTIVWGDDWGDDPRALLPRLEHDPGPALAALATRDVPAVDEVVDQGVRVPIHIVGRVSVFPGTAAGQPTLIVSRPALRRAAARAHILEPAPSATGLVWARGDPATIEPVLRRSSLAASFLTTADHLRRLPSVVAATRTYGFFRTIGTAAAILSLLALLLYLQARQRSQLIASAMARRMGLRPLADAAALALEAAVVVLGAGIVGVAIALAAARPIVHHVDPLPQYAPTSVFIVPWLMLALALAAAAVVAAAVGAAAAVLASRSDVAEALRVA